MKIAIIGHGNVGGALAQRWAAAGHQIVIGARNPEDEKVGRLTGASDRISAASIPAAVEAAEVILISTPAQIVADLAGQIGPATGKVFLDATNAVWKKPEPYPHGLAALKALTGATDVAKAFNTTGFENMADPQYGSQAADLFVAGDSQRAKEIATQLAKDAGFGEVYDFGGDDKAPLIEQFALAWINLAIMQGYGRNIAFKVLTR